MFNSSQYQPIDFDDFSFDKDVLWLVSQSRPYYYTIIFVLIYLEFYEFALFYAIGALTLIWEQDPEDRLGEDLTINSTDMKDVDSLTIITMEGMKDYLDSHNVNIGDFNFFEYFWFLENLDKFSNTNFFFNHKILFLFHEDLNDIKSSFTANLFKFDKDISNAANLREDKLHIIQSKLSKLSNSLVKNVKSKKKAMIKSRMKKLINLSSKLEDDLLYYRISVESHNIVMFGNI
jgi:hypothetical protein